MKYDIKPRKGIKRNEGEDAIANIVLSDSTKEHRSNPPSPRVPEDPEEVLEAFNSTIGTDISKESYSSFLEDQCEEVTPKSTKCQRQETPSNKLRSHHPQESQDDYTQESHDHHPRNTVFGKNVSMFTLAVCFALLSWMVIYIHQYNNASVNRFVQNYGDKNVKTCSYLELQQKYPNQSDSIWVALKVGTENMLNGISDVPDVYLFLHNDKDSIRGFIYDVAKVTSKCFDPQNKPFELGTDNFTTHEVLLDYGSIIYDFKTKVKENNAVVIANINEIPAEAARSLHTICDVYSPPVKNVIIFLTLIHSEVSDKHPVQVAQDAFRELWGSKLGSNELDPLITRVTHQVFVLKS